MSLNTQTHMERSHEGEAEEKREKKNSLQSSFCVNTEQVPVIHVKLT